MRCSPDRYLNKAENIYTLHTHTSYGKKASLNGEGRLANGQKKKAAMNVFHT